MQAVKTVALNPYLGRIFKQERNSCLNVFLTCSVFVVPSDAEIVDGEVPSEGYSDVNQVSGRFKKRITLETRISKVKKNSPRISVSRHYWCWKGKTENGNCKWDFHLNAVGCWYRDRFFQGPKKASGIGTNNRFQWKGKELFFSKNISAAKFGEITTFHYGCIISDRHKVSIGSVTFLHFRKILCAGKGFSSFEG